jgi:hypothetical protein
MLLNPTNSFATPHNPLPKSPQPRLHSAPSSDFCSWVTSTSPFSASSSILLFFVPFSELQAVEALQTVVRAED